MTEVNQVTIEDIIIKQKEKINMEKITQKREINSQFSFSFKSYIFSILSTFAFGDTSISSVY